MPRNMPREDPNDIGIDQTPNLRLTFRQVAVQASVLQCCRGLRGKQLQDRDPAGRKNVRGEVVLEVERPDKSGLVEQWQAKHRTGLAPTNVRIPGKGGLGGCIFEKDAVPGAQYVLKHRLRKNGLGYALIAQM